MKNPAMRAVAAMLGAALLSSAAIIERGEDK